MRRTEQKTEGRPVAAAAAVPAPALAMQIPSSLEGFSAPKDEPSLGKLNEALIAWENEALTGKAGFGSAFIHFFTGQGPKPSDALDEILSKLHKAMDSYIAKWTQFPDGLKQLADKTLGDRVAPAQVDKLTVAPGSG